MDKDLKGLTAVVTGASRGIGKGVAIELGAAGATVYVTGRTTVSGSASLPGTVFATADEVAQAGGVGVPVVCDHHSDDDVRRLFEQVREEQGGLDILVNNVFPSQVVTGSRSTRFWEQPVDVWDEIMAVGLRSHYVASVLAVPLMQGRNGLIVNISSSGARDYVYGVAYGVGKAGLDKFTADAAHELRDQGITVVSLWPGVTRTEVYEYLIDSGDESLKAMTHGIADPPSPRFVGRAVVSLARDASVAEQTGKHLPVARLADSYGFVDV